MLLIFPYVGILNWRLPGSVEAFIPQSISLVSLDIESDSGTAPTVYKTNNQTLVGLPSF